MKGVIMALCVLIGVIIGGFAVKLDEHLDLTVRKWTIDDGSEFDHQLRDTTLVCAHDTMRGTYCRMLGDVRADIFTFGVEER